jgi:DNA-binding CsgD family transcriptional regulator
VAESDAVLVEHAEATSTEAIHLLTRSGAQPEEIAAFYADFVTSLKQHASAAAGVWRPLLDAGLAVPGLQRERAWARLMLLLDPVEPVPGARIRSGRWIGFDPEAVAIARSTGDERSLARSVESFDYRSRQGTEELLSNVRGWHDPEAVMYGMTVVANDYQYRHGQFRAAGDLWNELSALAERNGALNWQAQAMNQLTLLHVATGRFEHARASEAQANALLDRLGAGRRSDVLEREMTTALAMEFGGDWSTLGWEWKAVAEDAALGPRDPATLMTSLNAAVSAYCFAEAGDREAARSMLTALTPVLEALTPTDANQNGAVAFAADTVWKIEATEFAHRYERLALDLQEYGIGDYPQSSIERAIAQMLALQGRFEEAIVAIKAARETAEATGQLPQHARTFLDEARIRSQANDPTPIKELLRQATERFTQLGMGEWSARATAGMHEFESKVAARGNSAGDLTDREIEVLRYVIRGYSDQHISEILFISPRTVHTHIRNMLSKTAAINRTELSVWAVARGIADGKQSS